MSSTVRGVGVTLADGVGDMLANCDGATDSLADMLADVLRDTRDSEADLEDDLDRLDVVV